MPNTIPLKWAEGRTWRFENGDVIPKEYGGTGADTAEGARLGIGAVSHGDIKLHCGPVPEGWLACEGQLLLIADYPLLFAAISNAFGGNGTTNFALPNYRSPGTGAKRIICVDYHTVQPVLQLQVPAAIHGPVGYYKAGTVLAFTVQSLEDVTITGGPVSLSIDIGGTAHTLAFVSSTAREWVFADYTVQAGDNGAVAATINLNGATLSSGGISAALSGTSADTGTIVDTTAPVVPTVDALSTANTTPTVTGTATVATGETLTVAVNSVTYTAGDGHLGLSGTTWTLIVPAANALAIGTYAVTAAVTDAAGNVSTDTTTNELVITA